MPLRILTVVGARPNFMKAAPIMRAIKQFNAIPSESRIEHRLVHTGQHYDEAMSDRFFVDLNMPTPDEHLGVGPGSQTEQIAEIMKRFEAVILRNWPDVVIVVGDVNSTLACSLATVKLPVTSDRCRPLLVHVEAGLRSFDRSMPEEINRILTDQVSDLLFVTEDAAIENLRREGIPRDRIFFVGNTMIDSLKAFEEQADHSEILDQLGLRKAHVENGGVNSVRPYALLTLHRPANVDNPDAFRHVLDGLSNLCTQTTVIFPVHPRTRKRIGEFGLLNYFREHNEGDGLGIRLVPPLGYLDFVCMMKNAQLVLTDSGGIQEETTCLGVRCVTLRDNTERPVTVTCGTNTIAGTSTKAIQSAIADQFSTEKRSSVPYKWDGKAAERIISVLTELLLKNESGCRDEIARRALAREAYSE